MLIFKTRWFHKWANREGISDDTLEKSVIEMNQGLIDANLGGNVYKKRIGISGRGKSSSVRTLLAFWLSGKEIVHFLFMDLPKMSEVI